MNNENISRRRTTIKTYKIILNSFMLGYLRLLEAQNCTLKLTNALLNFRLKPANSFEGNEYEKVLSAIKSISRSSFIAVEYVTAISNLVYATSLFDTFLTDTVTFLFLLIPESMGKDLQIPLQLMLSSKSCNAILQQVAKNKAREISFKTFTDRLQFFRDRFGMPVTISISDMEKLVHLTNIRNSAVHDQGILDLKRNRLGAITSDLKGCPSHPTMLSDRDADEAAKLYSRIVERVAFDVLMHILKVKKSNLPPNLKPYCKEIPILISKEKVNRRVPHS